MAQKAASFTGRLHHIPRDMIRPGGFGVRVPQWREDPGWRRAEVRALNEVSLAEPPAAASAGEIAVRQIDLDQVRPRLGGGYLRWAISPLARVLYPGFSSAPLQRGLHAHRWFFICQADAGCERVCFVPDLKDGTYCVRGTVGVSTSAPEVYALLQDYEGAPRVFANILSSKCTRDSDTGEVMSRLLVQRLCPNDLDPIRFLQIELLQSCSWRFLLLKGAFDVHMRVHESPELGSLRFTMRESTFMRSFEGRWQVIPEGPASCVVEHELRIELALPPPKAISPYVVSIFESQVEGILRDLVRELDRREGLDCSSAPSV